MLRGAPPAAGPTGTVGRARATPELHGAVRTYYEAAPSAVGPTGTTGSGRAAEASRRRMRISAPPAARPLLGSRAVRGPEELELLDPEWTYTSTHAHLGTAGRGTRKGTVGPAWDAGWPEELRDSEWPRGCRMARSQPEWPARSPLAAGGAEMCMRRRVAPAARARPMVPVEPTAGGAA